jgi:drug/metabolite transporter (DMT)-like permease
MASKRDQLHAYQFLVQRTVSALVTRETDPEQPPFRRPGTAAFAGIGIALVALAAVGVYGLINPGGNDSWRDGRSVIVEKETGTRYVYLNQRLHPVENYTSALLAIGTAAIWASSTILIKVMARTESAGAITTYMVLLTTPMTFVAALFVWQNPTIEQLGWAALLGTALVLAGAYMTSRPKTD